MCCHSVSSIYLAITIITFFPLLILAFINMQFLVDSTKGFKEPFEMKSFTDYKQELSLSFLVNITFGEKLSKRDDYGITSGTTKSVCYTGKCSNDKKKKMVNS